MWHTKNLLRKKTRSGLTIIGIALAAWVLVSLLGFNKGYESSLNRDIDNLGFQMIVTAKGCPYEAATLMLKGGTGLRYMPQSITDRSPRNLKWMGSRRCSCRPCSIPTRAKAGATALTWALILPLFHR